MPEEPAKPLDITNWFSIALDEIDYGMLLLSADLSVVHCNHAARRELNETHPLRLIHDQLCARTPAENDRLAAALRDSGHGLRRLLTFDAFGSPFMVAVVPVAPQSGDAGTLVVFGKSAACELLSAQGFARCYGLTPAERVVFINLSIGLRPNAIAARLGIAISTVRTHVKRIREKAGVSSVAVLLDMVARLPPLVSALKR